VKVKRVLVSQPEPENSEKSPFVDLAEQFNLSITFRKFIKIERIGAKEFRKQRINIPEYSAIIFTSKNAVDHFFGLCEELRVNIDDSMKYFCTSEAIALYLQKYIQYRKRKIFYGKSNFEDLLELIKKQKTEKYIFPCAENHKKDIPKLLSENKVKFVSAPIYRTVSDDLSEVAVDNYDLLVFFSPFGIKSLKENFPEFKQNNKLIATFGSLTAEAVKEAGLKLNICAPTQKAPSMTMAIEEYLKSQKK